MYFYLKLSNKSDDSKLKGITLFKNCKIPLILGEGKSEYYLDNRSENYWTDSEYTDEIVDCIKLIAKILPDARICYQSVEDEGSGESDVYCKLENDSIIYTCSTLWFEGTYYRIGEDGWCKQVVRQAIEWAEDEESPLTDIYDREVEIENGIIIKHSEEELEDKKNSKVIDEQDFSVQEVTENKVVSSTKITIVNVEEPVDISKESKKSLDNYKTVNKTSDASQKDWFVSPMPTTPVKQIRVKLNNGKSYEYASRYAVSEGSIAVIGYSLPVDFCCEISKSNNTGAMGYVEKISPNLTIKRRYAVEVDYIFNTNPTKTDLTRCVKYLKLGPEAYEKTLQFDKAVHPIRPIIYFARRILTATSILAHPNFVTEDDLKCAKNVILSRNHIDSKMIARSPGVALLESNVSEKKAQNTFNKIAMELGNHEDWDKDSGMLQSWSDVLNKFVSLSSVNEFVDKYSHVVAVSIMIRGGFLNLLKAYMSVTSLDEYRDEICVDLQGIDQTETFDFFKTAPKFVGDLSSAESGSQTIENNQQNRTTTSLLNMDKDVQEHNDQDAIFKAKEVVQENTLDEAYRKAQEEADKDVEHLYREAEERRIREEAERECKLGEEARKAREEAESKALEDAYRKAQEDAARRAALVAERQAREEAERQAREEEERQVRQEEERKKREEAERKTRDEEERKEREDVERKVREEDDRQVREAKEKIHITETAILNLEAQIAAEVKKAKEAKIAEERRLEEKTKESEIIIAAEEAQRSEERRLRRKKRAKKALIVLGIFLVLIVALVIVFAKVIFPKIAYKNAEELFAEGKYEQAESWYNALGDHEDGEIKLTVIRAYSQIEDGNYSEAIESLLEKGVCVTISYDIENDATLMASDVMLLSTSNNDGNTFTYTNKEAFDGMKSPSRVGYQFAEWSLVSYNYNEDNTFNLSLSSEWDVETYEINIDLDGGTANNRDSYTIEDATFSLVNPTKTGYTFIGWSCNNSETPTMTATIEQGSFGNVSYVAKWNANDYTINLDAAGGTVT